VEPLQKRAFLILAVTTKPKRGGFNIARTLADILGHADRPAVGWMVLVVAGAFVIGGL
jgi:hypothetical protein